MKFFYYLELVM